MKQWFAAALVAMMALPAVAAVTPMNIAEKSSYRLAAMIKRGSVPKAMATDLAAVRIDDTQLPSGAKGYQVVMMSPSNDPQAPNTVTILFGLDGKAVSEQINYIASSGQGPVFSQADGATLLDLGSEAIVDHLSEDAALPQVASLANEIVLTKAMTQQGDVAVFDIHMKDGHVYRIVMDLDGNVLQKGFAQ
jgi:hypothetical protein